jgi:hypothetical protein
MAQNLGVHSCNPIVRIMVSKLPSGLKKLVFLSSLIAHAHNSKNLEKQFIEEVAKSLNPKASKDNLELPMRLRKVLWGDREILHREIETLLNNDNFQMKYAAAKKIADTAPEWFIYSDRRNVAHDIANYFANTRVVLLKTSLV